MQSRNYVTLLITGGLMLASLSNYASEPIATSTVITEQQAKAPDETSEACPSTMQKLTLKFKPVLNAAAGMATLAGAVYLHDRSTTLVHEGAHAMAAELAGYTSNVYVSPQFRGGAYFTYWGCSTPIQTALIYLAGPLGSITAALAWFRIWNIAMRYWKSGDVKESVTKGFKDPYFNKDSSLLAIGANFYHIYDQYINNLFPLTATLDSSYGALAGTKALNDAAQIQEALGKIAPLLVKAYPFLAYAGLAGLMGYGAYGLYATYKAKKQSEKPTWW